MKPIIVWNSGRDYVPNPDDVERALVAHGGCDLGNRGVVHCAPPLGDEPFGDIFYTRDGVTSIVGLWRVEKDEDNEPAKQAE